MLMQSGVSVNPDVKLSKSRRLMSAISRLPMGQSVIHSDARLSSEKVLSSTTKFCSTARNMIAAVTHFDVDADL